MIRLEGFHVRLGSFTLGPLSVHVARGERVALVGPNGAGKSTTLRGLTGLLPGGYRGSARVDGLEVDSAGPDIRRTVGLLPERLLGFGWMSVAEHLRFLSSLYPGWDAARAEDLCRTLDVPAGTRLANLSRGMQVKLSLVSVEAYRPPVLLLDEPTSGIDPLMRDEVLSMLSRASGGGRTIVFSSHLLEDVERVADRVLLLREGRILEDVSVEELRATRGGLPFAERLVRRLRAP